MKYALLILAVVFSNLFGMAQIIEKSNPQLARHQQMLRLLLQHQTGNAHYKTTSSVTRERIVAQSTRDSVTGPLSDSVFLAYTSSRGSSFDFNDMIFAYNYSYGQTPLFNFEGCYSKPQILADTYMHWTLNPLDLSYGLYESNYAGYDLNNNLVDFREVFTDSVTNTNKRYVNSFSALNSISAGTWFNYISGTADSAFRQYFTYNLANRLVKDSVYEWHAGSWHLVAKTLYSYDASGNITFIDCYGNTADTTFDSILVEKFRYVNTYDASNRLLTVATNIYNGTSLAVSALDTFGYTGTHTFHTSWRDYQYDNINLYWAPMFNMTKTLNSLGLPDTVTTQGFDSVLNSWVPQSFNVFQYDTFNNPISNNEFDYYFGAYASYPSFTTNYYYSLYSYISTIVVKSPINDIKIFPNPSKETLFISGLSNIPSSTIAVSIYNAAGQSMLRELFSKSSDVAIISINSLNIGNYFLVVKDEFGNVLQHQTFVKE